MVTRENVETVCRELFDSLCSDNIDVLEVKLLELNADSGTVVVKYTFPRRGG